MCLTISDSHIRELPLFYWNNIRLPSQSYCDFTPYSENSTDTSPRELGYIPFTNAAT
jgi:hypothetical protein